MTTFIAARRIAEKTTRELAIEQERLGMPFAGPQYAHLNKRNGFVLAGIVAVIIALIAL